MCDEKIKKYKEYISLNDFEVNKDKTFLNAPYLRCIRKTQTHQAQ